METITLEQTAGGDSRGNRYCCVTYLSNTSGTAEHPDNATGNRSDD